jgi:hypothetical protein
VAASPDSTAITAAAASQPTAITASTASGTASMGGNAELVREDLPA